MQETLVQPLVWEDPTRFRAAKPCTTIAEPVLSSLGAATIEAPTPSSPPPQQEKPLQWEGCTSQLESSPQSPTRDKAGAASETQISQKKKKVSLKYKKEKKKQEMISPEAPGVLFITNSSLPQGNSYSALW